MSDEKRTICLYRVSGKKQVDFVDVDDKKMADIPMQRTACRDFASKMGWTIVDEKQENGVSGFKVSASNRDAIQVIKDKAIHGEFDILLVFMFDRIGRITSETPFIVEWLIENGIEVWSTQEGQQRIDSHTDRLTNYITYWQSEGESRKTSIRTKTRLGQLVEDGFFKGGFAPYGYSLERSGRFNKRGKELLELRVDLYQAEVVRQIFNLFVTKGYGPQRIATHLNKQNIFARSGKPWHPATIRGILRNCTYDGILRCGEKRSETLPDIKVLDDGVYQDAQEIIAQRSQKHKERSAPVSTTGRGLLSGNVFCGHCGSRLSMTSSVKSATANRERYVRYRYTCYGQLRLQKKCDGQRGYTMHILDDMIREIVHSIFHQFGAVPKEELVGKGFADKEKALRAEQHKKLREYERATNSLQKLNAEIIKSLNGESQFTAEQLSAATRQAQAEHDEVKVSLEELNLEVANIEVLHERMMMKYDKVMGWAKMFEQADTDTQRMIVSQLISKVTVHTNYELDIDLNVDISHFNLTCLKNVKYVNAERLSA